MRKLSPKVVEKLKLWRDPSVAPEDSSDPAYDAFFDAIRDLEDAFEDQDFRGSAEHLTTVQRQAGALIGFAAGIPGDGLLTGVVINSAHILPHAIRAASELSLGRTGSFLRTLSGLVPERLFGQSVDDRMTWADENEEQANKIEELYDTDECEDARWEAQHAAVRLFAENPHEFTLAKGELTAEEKRLRRRMQQRGIQ